MGSVTWLASGLTAVLEVFAFSTEKQAFADVVALRLNNAQRIGFVMTRTTEMAVRANQIVDVSDVPDSVHVMNQAAFVALLEYGAPIPAVQVNHASKDVVFVPMAHV